MAKAARQFRATEVSIDRKTLAQTLRAELLSSRTFAAKKLPALLKKKQEDALQVTRHYYSSMLLVVNEGLTKRGAFPNIASGGSVNRAVQVPTVHPLPSPAKGQTKFRIVSGNVPGESRGSRFPLRWRPLNRAYAARKIKSVGFWRKQGVLDRMFRSAVRNSRPVVDSVDSYRGLVTDLTRVKPGLYRGAFDIQVPRLVDQYSVTSPDLGILLRIPFAGTAVPPRGPTNPFPGTGAGRRKRRGKGAVPVDSKFDDALAEARRSRDEDLARIWYPENTRPWLARTARLIGQEMRKDLQRL